MNKTYTSVAYIFAVIYLTLWFVACKPKTQSATPIAAEGATLLLDSFQRAHEKHDLSALQKLYCDDGVPYAVRTIRLMEEGRYFSMPIVKMSLNAVPRQPLNSSSEQGVTMRPNLTQVAELEVEYRATGATVTRYYPVGLKNGEYLIVSNAVVSSSDVQPVNTGSSQSDTATSAETSANR